MSWKNTDRIQRESRASGATRLALLAIGSVAHQDGVMADTRYGKDELAALAGVSVRSYQRAVKALAAMGEIVYVRGIGRGRSSFYGVLVGLGDEARADVVQRVRNRATVEGGTFEWLDAETAAASDKGCQRVTLYPGERVTSDPERVTGCRPSSPSSVFVFPVPGEEQQQAGATSGEDERQGSTSGLPQAPPSPSRTPRRLSEKQAAQRDALVGLGVWDRPAERLVFSMDSAWIDTVIAAGRHLRARGRTQALGAAIVRIADGLDPLPPTEPPKRSALQDAPARQHTPRDAADAPRTAAVAAGTGTDLDALRRANRALIEQTKREALAAQN